MGLALLAHVLPQIHNARRRRLHLADARHVMAMHLGANGLKRAFLDSHTAVVVGHVHALVKTVEHDVAALDEHRAHASGGDGAMIGHSLLLLVGHHRACRRFNQTVFQRKRTDLDFREHGGIGEVLDGICGEVPIRHVNLRHGRRAARFSQSRTPLGGHAFSGLRGRLRRTAAERAHAQGACPQSRQAHTAQEVATRYGCFALYFRGSHDNSPSTPSVVLRRLAKGRSTARRLLALLTLPTLGEGKVRFHRPDSWNYGHSPHIDLLGRWWTQAR